MSEDGGSARTLAADADATTADAGTCRQTSTEQVDQLSAELLTGDAVQVEIDAVVQVHDDKTDRLD